MVLNNQRLIRSFGRIKSRKLSDHKKFLYESLLPKYEIKNIIDLKYFISNSNETYLEIGFGFGDFSFENAKNNPDINFVLCETHINGIVNLLAKLEIMPLNNIRIFKEDSRQLLDKITEEIFSKIYILFPDPWPKAKHYKRRLININFLNLVASKMKLDAKIIITTDHEAYQKWIITELLKSKILRWSAKSPSDWKIFPEDWVKTKYQKKAEIEGRNSVIIKAKKLQ